MIEIPQRTTAFYSVYTFKLIIYIFASIEDQFTIYWPIERGISLRRDAKASTCSVKIQPMKMGDSLKDGIASINGQPFNFENGSLQLGPLNCGSTYDLALALLWDVAGQEEKTIQLSTSSKFELVLEKLFKNLSPFQMI